ncbi:TMV resistance protein N-like [Prosopis cineraria]|uniref:TMV resistance protein N-like n=1 Tax=Prosopis cineraria TaxID=364024 RepID=UPI00240F0598|nr:TMV resistance protein N-like [Prosopis cineraria]
MDVINQLGIGENNFVAVMDLKKKEKRIAPTSNEAKVATPINPACLTLKQEREEFRLALLASQQRRNNREEIQLAYVKEGEKKGFNLILESKKSLGREVIPIFYKTDPSDVHHQRGTFACAFQKHSQRFSENKEKVQRWREALKEVVNISGYDSTDQHEAKLIEEIIAAAWAKVQPKLPYCFNNEFIGIETRVEEVSALLNIGLCDVGFIGIWGMTGIGKTTLARVIYERIFHQFDVSCFLANVKENHEAKGFVSLQRKLLSKLMIRDIDIDDAYEGKNITRNFLCSKKVLVVLDDQEDVEECCRSMKEYSTSNNSEIPSQHSLYAYGKRSHQVEEVAEEDNIVATDEAETFSAKRRKL